ncbi:hypothetical protein [Delftia tsuruhatensis]|uniref:hypothetical protein n=1 Tax=Delftia tsuruhatensis TaxID=180282 RepID=UPI003A8BBC8A
MHFYKLPRGIQETTRSNKDGSQVLAYRVQMNRKGVKLDKLFPSVQEALDFLNDERKKLKLKKLVIEQDEQKIKAFKLKSYDNLSNTPEGKEFVNQYLNNPTFDRYITKYIDEFLKIKYRTILNRKLSELTAEEKHKLKNYTNKVNKLERMSEIKVQDFDLGALEIATKGFNARQRKIGSFTLEEITVSTINSYVKSRIQDNLRASSIRTELVLMNSVLEYSKHLNSDLKEFKNPIKDFDKKLYSLAIPAKSKFFRFADNEEENKTTKKAFIEAVEKNKNPELVFIVKLMMLTAMRRAEVVLLKWSQIYDNFIQLTDTKTNPRPVYLTADAKELIKSIPRKAGQDRLFCYTVGGFEASLRYHLNKFGLKDITAHKLRKNSISEFVEVIGADNSLLISEILGIRDIAGLEREIKTMPTASLSTQTEVLKSVGHTTSAVTKKHYFSLNLKKQK